MDVCFVLIKAGESEYSSGFFFNDLLHTDSKDFREDKTNLKDSGTK